MTGEQMTESDGKYIYYSIKCWYMFQCRKSLQNLIHGIPAVLNINLLLFFELLVSCIKTIRSKIMSMQIFTSGM